ncbi:MAG: Xylose isomerase domain protein barrel [Actinomycetia bacterium]|nr:Xylose isomerase domain protein barrel [Actinomycetes bacterium]
MNSLSSASWTLEQDLDLYAELGVTGVSLFLDKATAVGVDKAADLLAGFDVVHVFARGFTLHDPATWPDDQARLREGVELAAALGAPWFGMTAGAAGRLSWDEAAAALGRAIEPLAVDGVRLAVEHSLPVRPEIGFVHSLKDCIELADRLGVGATMEVNYCFAERDLPATLAAGAGSLATVQVSDLVPPSTVLPDRAVPGDGVIPLADVLALVLGAGYAGPVELEMLGPRIEAEGYGPALRRAVAALDAILAEVAPA